MLNGTNKDVINKKLSSTEEQIASVQSSSLPDFQKDLLLGSLMKRSDQLNLDQKYVEEYSKEMLSFVFKGERFNTGKIPVKLLSNFLDELQMLTTNIVNQLINGARVSKRVPKSVLMESELYLSDVFTGSFGVVIEGFDKQQELVEDSVMSNSINKLTSLLELSNQESFSLEKISLNSPFTIKKFKEFVHFLANERVDLEVNWKSIHNETKKLHLSADSITTFNKKLEAIDELEERNVILKGILTSVNTRNETFEILTDENEIIKGNAPKEMLIRYRQYIDEQIEALTTKFTTLNKVTEEAKHKWYLQKINK